MPARIPANDLDGLAASSAFPPAVEQRLDGGAAEEHGIAKATPLQVAGLHPAANRPLGAAEDRGHLAQRVDLRPRRPGHRGSIKPRRVGLGIWPRGRAIGGAKAVRLVVHHTIAPAAIAGHRRAPASLRRRGYDAKNTCDSAMSSDPL